MRSSAFRAGIGVAVAMLGLQLAAPQSVTAATVPGTASNFTLVGHNSLFDRGVNAAGGIFDHYMYIGSRSDGTHPHSGVQIVDIANPANPVDVGEIPLLTSLPVGTLPAGPPMTAGYTSRELRVWPQQQVLMIIYFGCSALIHACVSGSDTGEQPLQRILFYDLGSGHAAAPVLTSIYTPSVTPHEMFLWVDPHNPNRALMYWTSPNNSTKQLVVTDISAWKTASFPEVATLSTPSGFTAADQSAFDVRLHSLSISPDGARGYLAYLGGGVLVIDTSDLAAGVAKPTIKLITPISGRALWDYEGAHSSVKIPGKPYILTTEEIYGKGTPALGALFGPAFGGCPWGWMRIVDASDPTHLKVVSEFKIDENQAGFCANVPAAQDNFSSYASHNPTVLPDLAFATWHSGGLRAVDLTDPTHPVQDGVFVPTPDTAQPGEVHTPDPALEAGSNGTIGWSYPIIRNGLIYYVDVANGLYILRYTGPHADEVAGISFLEGNSSLGDAARLAAVPATSVPEAPAAWPALLLGGAALWATSVFAQRRRRAARA
jgi:hypothetical protein